MPEVSFLKRRPQQFVSTQQKGAMKRRVRPMAEPKRRQAGLPWQNKALDVCLVAVWGLSIPGLMWLAAAGGF